MSTLSLHHWPDPVRGFQELHRVLKSGGQFIVFDLRRGIRRFEYFWLTLIVRRVVPRALRYVNEPLGSFLASYTPEEVERILAARPFERTQIEPSIASQFVWGRKN